MPRRTVCKTRISAQISNVKVVAIVTVDNMPSSPDYAGRAGLPAHGFLASEIDFQVTVPRRRVHRTALAEVFVTDLRRVAEDSFLCGAQMPRSHAYFGDTDSGSRHYDPLLVVEAVRQAVMAGAHEYYGVPESDKFILTRSSIQVVQLAGLLVGPAPAQLALDVGVVGKRVNEDRVSGLEFEVRVLLGTTVLGHVGMGMVYKTPASYRRLREQGRADAGLGPERRACMPVVPAPAHLVGRRNPDNVVLGAVLLGESGCGRAQLHVDESHPSIFDHPQDHIPGMLMNEAYRQIAVSTAEAALALHPRRARLTRLDSTYTRFGELDLPAFAVCQVGAPAQLDGEIILPVEAALEQETPISTAKIELRYALGVPSC